MDMSSDHIKACQLIHDALLLLKPELVVITVNKISLIELLPNEYFFAADITHNK